MKSGEDIEKTKIILMGIGEMTDNIYPQPHV